MLNKNKLYRSGLIEFDIYWQELIPHILIRALPNSEFEFSFSLHGLLLNYSSLQKYSGNRFNRYAFCNRALWKVAGAGLSSSIFQNTIILNEKGNICECIENNIFMVKSGNLYTPSADTGCYTDTLRNIIMELAVQAGLKPAETATLKVEDLKGMSEIFIASEEHGINWILGVDDKRFIHHYSLILLEKLNGYLKNKVS